VEGRLALIADEAERGGGMTREGDTKLKMERGRIGGEGGDSLQKFDVRTKMSN